MSSKPVQILLVEDSPGDVRLAQEALAESRMLNELTVVRDGVEAMAYLRRRGKFSKATRPDLVLLDLNLPKRNGREVLAEVKGDEDLKTIPIVVLTTSQAQEDVARAYCLGANCYIAKPTDFDHFIQVVKLIEKFWFTAVKLWSPE